MKGPFGICVVTAAALAVVFGLTATSAKPQAGQVSVPGFGKPNAKPLPPGGPAPRTPQGHPDLSGVWFPGTTGGEDLTAEDDPAQKQIDPKEPPEEKPPFQPWAAAKLKGMSRVDLELLRPSVNCLPRGVPGMFITNPYPIQLVQTADQLVQLDELNNNFRVIPIDGRAHQKNPDPAFNGDAVGRWEGDTLVIDVTAIDVSTWNNFTGWFHSDQEHVVEKLTRLNKNHLVYQVTIEDPKVLSKPWVSAPRRWSLGHEALSEYYCTNNKEEEALKALKALSEGSGSTK